MLIARRRSQLTAGAALLIAAILLGACDWPQSRYGPDRTGFNPFETTISPANVSQLRMRWSQYTHSYQAVTAASVIASGTLYVGTDKLYALDANSGSARWSSGAIGIAKASPAVDDGAVYVNATEGGTTRLHAFDA